ncbi:hypothetical protein MTO96_022698 [Rhipicephalus appendiculatus]
MLEYAALPTERTTDSSTPQAKAIMAASPKRVRSADAKKERSRERTKKSRTASTSSSRSSSAASSGSSSSGSSSSGSSSSGSSRSSSSSSSSSSRSTSVSPRRRRNRVSRSASGARGGGGDAGSKTANATSSSSSRRKRTPTPPRPCKIHVGRLTRNVTRDHLLEIFGCYGAVKSVELPPDRTHSHLSRGFAYIEFENPADAERAMRHMDGAHPCPRDDPPAPPPSLAKVTPTKVTSAKVASAQRTFRPKSSVKPTPLPETITPFTVPCRHGRRTEAPRTFKLQLLTLTIASVLSKVLIYWHHL